MRPMALFFTIAVMPLICSAAPKLNVVDETSFLEAVASVESRGRNGVVGDRHLANKAYGQYQIRVPYLRDVNRVVGKKEIRRVFGKDRLSMQDMKDPVRARWAMRQYLGYYGARYTRITGRHPTAEVYARIHNGGPDGWRDKSTRSYWARVSYQYTLYAALAAARRT